VTSEDDSDVCNLASINMSRISSIKEFIRINYLVSKFLVCGTLKADLPYQKVKEVREKNRRLGLGLNISPSKIPLYAGNPEYIFLQKKLTFLCNNGKLQTISREDLRNQEPSETTRGR